MRIIFFGADRWFSEPVLEAILKAGIEVALIVTKGNAFVTPKSKIKDQRSKIIQAKAENDISVERLEAKFNEIATAAAKRRPRNDRFTVHDSQFAKDNRPDAIVLASFGPPFLAAEVLKWPEYGCLNVHASLLPRWRGASPVFAALSAGDKETGVSIMRMTEEIDRGTVLGQKKIKIKQPILPSSRATPTLCRGSRETQRSDLNRSLRSLDPSASLGMTVDTRETLTKRLGLLGGELIVETLKKLEKGQITEVRQPEKSPTPYTRRLTKGSGRIDWSQSPIEIERFIRAVTPWPGAWANAKLKTQNSKLKIVRLKILKTHLEQKTENRKQKTMELVIDSIQLPGKNPVSWKQFLAGHPGAELG